MVHSTPTQFPNHIRALDCDLYLEENAFHVSLNLQPLFQSLQFRQPAVVDPEDPVQRSTSVLDTAGPRRLIV